MKKTSQSKNVEMEIWVADVEIMIRVSFISDRIRSDEKLTGSSPFGITVVRNVGTPYSSCSPEKLFLPAEYCERNFRFDLLRFATADEAMSYAKRLKRTVGWLNARDYSKTPVGEPVRATKIL